MKRKIFFCRTSLLWFSRLFFPNQVIVNILPKRQKFTKTEEPYQNNEKLKEKKFRLTTPLKKDTWDIPSLWRISSDFAASVLELNNDFTIGLSVTSASRLVGVKSEVEPAGVTDSDSCGNVGVDWDKTVFFLLYWNAVSVELPLIGS